MPTWPCDVCDAVRLTKGKSTGLLKKSCVCGERHRVCWDCCRQLAITGEWPFPVCPRSDEFKVAVAVMREDLPPPPPVNPETVERITRRRAQIFLQAALKARREGEQ